MNSRLLRPDPDDSRDSLRGDTGPGNEASPDPAHHPGDIHNEGLIMSTDQSKLAEEPIASTPDGSAVGEQQAPPPRRKRRWLRVLVWLIVLGLVGVAALIALLPAILSSGPVTRRIAAGASDALDRDVR